MRLDGFIGFRAVPADKITMDALDAHLTTYFVPNSVSYRRHRAASNVLPAAEPMVRRLLAGGTWIRTFGSARDRSTAGSTSYGFCLGGMSALAIAAPAALSQSQTSFWGHEEHILVQFIVDAALTVRPVMLGDDAHRIERRMAFIGLIAVVSRSPRDRRDLCGPRARPR